MRQELVNQLYLFENFVEQMDKFVTEIKTDNSLNELDIDFGHYDLRSKNGDIFELPFDLYEYFPLWECVIFYKEKDPKKKGQMGNEMFFDLYWNDVKGNSAYYQNGCTFWVTFNEDSTMSFYYQI